MRDNIPLVGIRNAVAISADAVVVSAVGKTWWDSNVNLFAGLTFLIALTVLYFMLRGNALQSEG